MAVLLGKEVNKPLMEILLRFDPQLLEESGLVSQLKIQYQDELARLNALLRSRQEVGGVLCRVEQANIPESIWLWLTEFAHEVVQFKQVRKASEAKQLLRKKDIKLLAIGAGLSFMQFLAISEILGASIQNIELETLPILLVSGVAAVSITFGSKEALIRWVKATRSIDSFPIPFWRRLRCGDTLAWCSVAIVLMEIAFSAPGMLSLLPPRLAAELLPQVSAYLASGLAAFVNVFLAYGVAFEELDLEKRYMESFEVKREVIDNPLS